MTLRYPRALTIAGSDSGGGAGIQADLKTFAANGCYGASVITAVTAQNTRAVNAVEVLPAALVGAQIDAVLSDIGADAIKIGMLGNAAIIETVADALTRWQAAPVVLDPVMVAKSGDPLLEAEAVQALRSRLLPLATLLTPNLPEAAALLGQSLPTRESMPACARALLAAGARAVLLKGGHLAGAPCDLLAWTAEDGSLRSRWFESRRVATRNTHGTGCTLAAAIAAGLARGNALEAAVAAAHTYLQTALARGAAYTLGTGHGPVHHFHALWEDSSS